MKEGIQYGMIGYFIPHSVYPDGYHCSPDQPLPFMGIASQRNHMAVYLFCIYGDEAEAARFEKRWAKSGKNSTWASPACASRRSRTCASPPSAPPSSVTAARFIEHYEANVTSATARGKKTAARRPRRRSLRRREARPQDSDLSDQGEESPCRPSKSTASSAKRRRPREPRPARAALPPMTRPREILPADPEAALSALREASAAARGGLQEVPDLPDEHPGGVRVQAVAEDPRRRRPGAHRVDRRDRGAPTAAA